MRKRKIISIRMEETLYDKLTKVAENDNMFVGELCRNFIKGGLENEQNQHKKNNRQKNL